MKVNGLKGNVVTCDLYWADIWFCENNIDKAMQYFDEMLLSSGCSLNRTVYYKVWYLAYALIAGRMDDANIVALHQSRNRICSVLIKIATKFSSCVYSVGRRNWKEFLKFLTNSKKLEFSLMSSPIYMCLTRI